MKSLLVAVLAVQMTGQIRADSREERLEKMANNLGDVDPGDAHAITLAAMSEETDVIPAEMIIRMSWLESRFKTSAGPLCGVMQVNPRDLDLPMSRCRVWRASALEGIRAGMEEIRVMMADRRVHGDVRRMLLYRACGNAAFNGTCHKWRYPSWVLDVNHKE